MIISRNSRKNSSNFAKNSRFRKLRVGEKNVQKNLIVEKTKILQKTPSMFSVLAHSQESDPTAERQLFGAGVERRWQGGPRDRQAGREDLLQTIQHLNRKA